LVIRLHETDKIIVIGLILLLASGIFYFELINNYTYGLAYSESYPVDFQYSGLQYSLQTQTYNNQTYVVYFFTQFIIAHPQDEVAIITTPTRNNSGNWATCFISANEVGYGNYSPLNYVEETFSVKQYPTYSGLVEQTLGANPSNSYGVSFGVNLTFPVNERNSPSLASLGAYNVTINVYSRGANQIYLMLFAVSIVDGFIAVIIGSVMKRRYTKSKLAQPVAG